MVSRVLEITGLEAWVNDWNPEWSNGSPMGSSDSPMGCVT
jgi:hypothetical protein